MNNCTLIAIPLSLLLLVIAGCDSIGSNDPKIVSAENKNIIQAELPLVKNERLYFESKTDFGSFMDHLIDNQDLSYLDEIERSINDFVSLRTVTDEFLSRNMDDEFVGDQEMLRIVEDPVFESVLNRDAEIQIADSVYKVTYNYVYSVNVENANLLSDIQLRPSFPSKQSTEPIIRIVEIDRSKFNDISLKANSAETVHGRGECWASFNISYSRNRKYRLKGSSWIINWLIYRSFGSELESQQIRRRGAFKRWFHLRVKKVTIDATFSTRLEDSKGEKYTLNRRFRYTKYNAAEIRHTYARDRSRDILGANIQASFYALKGIGDDASCSSTRSWNW